MILEEVNERMYFESLLYFKTNLFETLISTLKVIPTILNSFTEILKYSQNIFGLGLHKC